MAIPVGAGIWVLNHNNDAPTTASSSSTVESTTESSTTESSTTESTSETSSSTSESSSSSSSSSSAPASTTPSSSEPAQQENNAGQENTQTDQGQGATGTEEYTTVQAGEGPEQVAARTGISVETLYQLNGIDPNNYMLYPGDTLRIK